MAVRTRFRVAAVVCAALLCGVLVYSLLSAHTGAPVAARAADSSVGNCDRIALGVALNARSPADKTISGTLCTPLQWAPGAHEIDVLTPGGGYNSLYWDWPQDPPLYSYVDKTLQAGRATFDYDRIGTGGSTHPLSTDVTFGAETYVLHEIVSWLRSSRRFGEVNLVGHSYGSAVTVQEAGSYHDASRVVVTSLAHVPNAGAGLVTSFLSLLHPADLDPQFAGEHLDPGYLASIPHTRGELYSSAADPAVIAYDEAHSDVISATALTGFAAVWAQPPGINASSHITAPVLVLVGQDDWLFCNAPGLLDCSSDAALRTGEAPYYGSAASFTAAGIPATGHDIALHPSAGYSFSIINSWIHSTPAVVAAAG
jgi:pimeloyl-ACP methyl ester carboxylesterase